MDCGPLESRLDRLGTSTVRPWGLVGEREWFERRCGCGGSIPMFIEREDMRAQTFIGRKRVRKFFGKIEEVAEMPNLM